MRAGKVYKNNVLAGKLTEDKGSSYRFVYDDKYYLDESLPSISVTLTKESKEYYSKYLFPFFFNMLSEGVNRQLQCRQLKIDENDDFGLLLKTAQYDTVGSVIVKPITD